MVVLTSFTLPTDGIRHRQNNTTVYVNDNNLGKGTLYIAESRLSWVSDSGNGFSLEYPSISLHAVSRDLSAFPQECLFLMLDAALDEDINNGDGENDGENGNDSDDATTEMRLVPDDRGMLDAMFHAMNACQALHPDPEDSFSDEDFYEDADEIPMEEADHRMAGLRIENMDGSSHTLDEEDMEEDRVGGMVGGMLGSMGGRISEDRVGGTLRYNMMFQNLAGQNISWVGRDERSISDRVGGTLEGRAGDRVEVGAGNRMEGRVGDRAEVEVGAGNRVGVGLGASNRAVDMSQDDMSFASGNKSHLDNSACGPPARSPQMDSDFSDAES